MSPTIRIDDEVYEVLKSRAEPFVDTPNTVLRRVLSLDSSTAATEDLDLIDDDLPRPTKLAAVTNAAHPTTSSSRRPGKKTSSAKRRRAPAGVLLPEVRYEAPLLAAILELGGAAPSRLVIDLVGEKLKDDLTEVDKEKLSSGGIRWQSRVQFVRIRLIERGLMTKEAPRGVWAISEAGREFIEQHESGVA